MLTIDIYGNVYMLRDYEWHVVVAYAFKDNEPDLILDSGEIVRARIGHC